jgi:hypothetical protein
MFLDLDFIGELNDYNYIGPLSILSSAGGLFASLRLLVILILSVATLKFYKLNVVKAIKKDSEKYSKTNNKTLIDLMVKRLSCIELFHLHDRIDHIEHKVEKN